MFPGCSLAVFSRPAVESCTRPRSFGVTPTHQFTPAVDVFSSRTSDSASCDRVTKANANVICVRSHDDDVLRLAPPFYRCLPPACMLGSVVPTAPSDQPGSHGPPPGSCIPSHPPSTPPCFTCLFVAVFHRLLFCLSPSFTIPYSYSIPRPSLCSSPRVSCVCVSSSLFGFSVSGLHWVLTCTLGSRIATS